MVQVGSAGTYPFLASVHTLPSHVRTQERKQYVAPYPYAIRIDADAGQLVEGLY